MKYTRSLLWCLMMLHATAALAKKDVQEPEPEAQEEEHKEPPFNPLHRMPTGGLQTLFLPGPAVHHPTYGDFTKQNRLYVGAGSSGMKGYAITSFVANHNGVPMIPETVIVNHSDGQQPHPVYDQKICCMQRSGDALAVVTEHDCDRIMVIENFGNPQTHVLQTDTLRGTVDGTNVSIQHIAIGATGMEEGVVRQYVFAALKDEHGYDSLAMAKIDGQDIVVTTTTEDGKTEEETLVQSCIYVPDAEMGKLDGNRALDLKPYISSIGECESYVITGLCWDQLVERLYITLRVTNSSSQADQATWTLLMASVINDCLVVEPCMPLGYARHADAEFIAYGKSATAQSDAVYSFHPSLGGIYVLVQRDNHLGAFPVVNKSKQLESKYTKGVRALVMQDDEHGAFATKQAPLHDYYFRRTRRIHERYFEDCLNEDEHGFMATDAATKVGGYGVLPGPIEHVEFSGDAVLASVKKASGFGSAGVFLSQPIYDQYGKIAAWSCWERVAISKQPTVYACFDLEHDHYLTLECIQGDDEEVRGKVRMTLWENCKKQESTDAFTAMLNRQFEPDKGGITSMSSYDGMCVITGPSKIMIADVGREYTIDDVMIASSNDGTLNALRDVESAAAIEVCGGQLGIDPYIMSTAVVYDGNQYWLCCAGTGGVFIIRHPDGSGVSSMREYCTHTASDMEVHQLPDFSRVKKIVAHGEWLYMLTARSCERYSLSTGQRVTLATPDDLNSGLFNDMIISGDMALLATMKGVYCGGPGSSALRSQSVEHMNWQRVTLAQETGYPIKKFFAVTQTGYEHDLALGGQLFAVASSSRLQQTTIHRLYCIADSQQGVTAESVVVTPGYAQKDVPLALISCGSQRDGMYTNGAQFITYRGRVSDQSPVVEFAASHLKTRSGIYVRDLGRMRTSPGIKKAFAINGVFLEPVTGRLLLYGDFGARVHK